VVLILPVPVVVELTIMVVEHQGILQELVVQIPELVALQEEQVQVLEKAVVELAVEAPMAIILEISMQEMEAVEEPEEIFQEVEVLVEAVDSSEDPQLKDSEVLVA